MHLIIFIQDLFFYKWISEKIWLPKVGWNDNKQYCNSNLKNALFLNNKSMENASRPVVRTVKNRQNSAIVQ